MNYDNYYKKGGMTKEESISAIALRIGARKDAVEKFVEEHKIDTNKLNSDLKSGDVYFMDVITAIVGKPNNKYQKEVIKKYGSKMAKGGEISVYNLRKGDKVKTRKGDIETIIRRTGSGSYETIENDYTHSPESLEFLSRPSRKMAMGGKTQGYDDREDERLGMKYGKMSGKDFDGSDDMREHSRRDDARFEERMARGGELTYDDFMVGDFYFNSSEGGKFKFVGKDESGRLRFQDSKGIDRIFSPKRMSKYADGGIMARGGYVSKGELVWKKLTKSERMKFLHENFTPQITPRTQETLVGKDYNFLPKNVKIVMESKYANVENYADGGKMEKNIKIKDFYVNEFPTDDMGEDINPNATFHGLYRVLNGQGDVYEYMGVSDSLVRERVFEKLANIKDVDYNEIYNLWLKSDDKLKNGGMMADDKYVVVSENDGYWYIMSTPTSEQSAKDILNITTIPRGEVGKVVTLEEAKNHKKVIGREYLKMANGGMMAKGGKANMVLNNDQFMMLQYINDRNEDGEDEEKYIILGIEDTTSLTRFDLEYYREYLINLGYLADIDDTYLVTPKGKEYLKQYNEKELAKKMANGGMMAKGGRLKEEDDSLLGYEPYFEKDVAIASIDRENKIVRPTHGYYPKHPMSKKAINWAKKHGYDYIADGKKYADGGQIDEDTLWELSSLVMDSINPENKLSLDEFLYAHRNGEKPLMTDKQEKLVVFVLKMYDDVENITEKTLNELATLVMDSINSDVHLPLYKFMDEVPLTYEQEELCAFVLGMFDYVAIEYVRVEDSKRFAKGGAIEDQYEGRSPQDIWDSLDSDQRYHFINDHALQIEMLSDKNFDYNTNKFPKEMTSEFVKKAYRSDWKDLDEVVQNRFANHVRQGEYAKGGMMAKGGLTKTKTGAIKLYYHQTSGGAEYLCSSKVKGTKDEGSLDSEYIVRIDGAKDFGGELLKKGVKLYYHQTSGGAEYLCSSKVKGTKDEGSFDSEYIVRIDGAKDFGGELLTKVLPYAKGGMMAKGGKTEKKKFTSYTILNADEYGNRDSSSKKKPTKFYIVWYGNAYQLFMDKPNTINNRAIFDNDDELKKAIDKVRYSTPTYVNYGLPQDQKFYKEFIVSEKFEYAKGGALSQQNEMNKKVLSLIQKAKIESKLEFGQLVVSALTDANAHSEVRKFISIIENKPEWAEKPNSDYINLPFEQMIVERKKTVYGSKYYDANEKINDLGIKIANMSGWEFETILDSLIFSSKMIGRNDVAKVLEKLNTDDDKQDATKNKWEYTDKDEIEYVVVKDKNGKELKFDGKNVLSGVHDLLEKGGKLTEIGKYYSKNDVVSVVVNGKNILDKNTVSGVWIKKDAKPMAEDVADMKIGKTTLKKGFNGWVAKTMVDNFKGFDWDITTIKNSRGDLTTTAQGGKSEDKGGYKMFTFMVFQDPAIRLKSSRPARVTDKVVSAQHEEAMKDFKERKEEIAEMVDEIQAKKKSNDGAKITFNKLADGGYVVSKADEDGYVYILDADGKKVSDSKIPSDIGYGKVKNKFVVKKAKYDTELGKNDANQIVERMNSKYAKGGAIGFDALAKKVAKNYEGDKVKKEFQDEYGKTYDKQEAEEVGKKVAGKVYRQQQAKGKMAKGGKTNNRSENKMTQISRKASEIRKADESWRDAFNRAKAMIG
jgi:hypothetical protein